MYREGWLLSKTHEENQPYHDLRTRTVHMLRGGGRSYPETWMYEAMNEQSLLMVSITLCQGPRGCV
jgi:hypothetical protein